MPPRGCYGKPDNQTEVAKARPAFHEKAALALLARDGIGVIWKLHLDAANAYRGGFLSGSPDPHRDARCSGTVDAPLGERGTREDYGMTGIAMFRVTLLTIATAFGALGIFFLYYSCMSAPIADYAAVFLAMASGIAWFVEKFAEHC
jgi:hypothetical protein